MKVIFFGTPTFAANILNYLIDNNVNIIAVVTQSDKRRGKIPEVKKVAEQRIPNVPIYQPEKATDPTFIETMKGYNPDIFIVVAYGKILRQALLDVPKIDSINIHASILPKYRGAAPIQRVLMDGERKTGITIMQMTAGLDSGDIIATDEMAVDKNMNFGLLHDNLSEIAKPLILKVLADYERGNVKKISQDDLKSTYALKIMAEDMDIDFNRDATSIHNQIRALTPSPGARCTIEINGNKKIVKIFESEVISCEGEKAKNILEFEKDNFIVACKKDAISIKKLQVEGKKGVSVDDFIRGIRNPIKII